MRELLRLLWHFIMLTFPLWMGIATVGIVIIKDFLFGGD